MAGNVAFHTDEQFLTLGIDGDVFAIPVSLVREILDMRPMSRIPEAPVHLAGLVDVRGQGVPVVDLRVRLGLAPAPPGDATRILVLETQIAGRSVTIGMVVDRVFEVTPLDDGAIEAPPDIGLRWRSDHILGVGRRGESFVVVFNLEQLFAADGEALATGADGQPDQAADAGAGVAAA
jgi:purine-binding chemotaxis protein CheW